MKTIIITTYSPTASARSGVAYRQKLEALAITRIQNYPITKLCIDLNKDISRLIHQGEHIIFMGYWNSESPEVNTWMEKQGLTNTICNLHRYSKSPITHQRSKDCPINGIYRLASLTENRGVHPYPLGD